MLLRFGHWLAPAFVIGALCFPHAHAQSGDSIKAPSYAVLQQQLLDATKKANEQALEQIKAQSEDAVKASKEAIEQANKIATESANQNKQVLETLAAVSAKTIETAQSSNSFTETVLKLWTGALALVAGIFGFLGWKELKSVRQSFEAAVAQIKAEGAAQLQHVADEANASMRKLLEDTREKGRIARLLTIDLSMFSIDPVIRTAAPDQQNQLLIADLFKRLSIMEGYAITLDDTRTQCWIHGQRALLHYFSGSYVKAWEHQELAFPLLVDITRFHVHQNLACFTSKVFETQQDEKARKRSREVLLLLVEYVVPRQAKELLDDPDLVTVLRTEADVKNRLEAVVSGTPTI